MSKRSKNKKMEKEEKTKDKRQKTKEFMIPVRKLLTKRTVTQTLMGMILDTTIKTALLPFTNMDADNSNASTNGSMAAIAAPACVGAMESIRFNVSLSSFRTSSDLAFFLICLQNFLCSFLCLTKSFF